MACNYCETQFQSAQALVITFQKLGSSANVLIQNQGRNIVFIQRITLCVTPGTILYLRPPPQSLPWTYPSATLDPGVQGGFYLLKNVPPGAIVQALAEYVEIDGRSQSCPFTLGG